MRGLVDLHGLDHDRAPSVRLMELLGGNPYLVRRTLYALAVEGYELQRLIDEAMRAEGPLGDHLERHRRHLQRQPEMAAALREVLHRSRCTDARICRALEGAGLTRREADGRIAPRYGLYRDFFLANPP